MNIHSITFTFTDVIGDNHLNRIFHAMNNATSDTFSIDSWTMDERIDMTSTWSVTARVELDEIADVVDAITEHNGTFLSHSHFAAVCCKSEDLNL